MDGRGTILGMSVFRRIRNVPGGFLIFADIFGFTESGGGENPVVTRSGFFHIPSAFFLFRKPVAPSQLGGHTILPSPSSGCTLHDLGCGTIPPNVFWGWRGGARKIGATGGTVSIQAARGGEKA